MKENKNLSTYMSEVGAFDLLSQEEEKALFRQMQKWSNNQNKCSASVERKGKEARDILIQSNLRLVIKIAKDFRNIGLDYADLINEGNIGLMNAIDKFDLKKGARLSYYASFWIKQSIRRSISNKGRTIRLPVALIESKLKIHKYIDKYETENFRQPTNEEISEGLEMPLKKVNKLLKLSLQSGSLNVQIDEENSRELIDVIEDEEIIDPSVLFDIKSENELLSKLLKRLDKRRRYIIMRRFGLDGSKPDTLEVIGTRFNLTRERIRQLELSALISLREMYKKIDKNEINE